MKPLVLIPKTVLSSPAKTVIRFDRWLNEVITEMKQTLVHANNPKGVGLAAPQIGEPWRIFLTRPKEADNIRVFINAEIISKTAEESKQNDKLEGCLSIPGIWGKVHRALDLTLKYQDETGESHIEPFTGFLATIIQHETDHINGVLFTQRVLEQKEKLYQTTRDEKNKEVLEEISLR